MTATKLKLILALPIIALAFGFLALPHSAKAATYTVTTTDDAGAGSLRQAIADANGSAGADTIAFNIAGAGVHTIAPLTALPAITDAVTVDGSTQPGASCDPRVLLIEISGENIDHNNHNNGIQLTDGSSNSIVKGLVINRFTYSGDEDILAGVGVLINGDSGSNTIVCNHVGSNADGNSAFGNMMGVGVVNGSGLNNLIGGITSADRNLVSGNSIGIGVLDSTAVTVVGNYVGTDITGDNSLRNSYGVYVIAQNITSLNFKLGGTSAGAGNVISGNYYNVAMFATDVDIQGNFIGTNASGSDRIITIDGGENSIGLYIVSGQNINIGGTAIGARNIISGNGYGMNIGGDNTVSNLSVAGNYIGPNADGSACVGSGILGIIMGNVNNIVIGGNSAAARNVISCQTYSGAGYGIAFSANGASQDNTIQGNYIGTNITGQISSGFGNVGEGIVLANVSGSLIGGTGSGEGNVIAGNGGAGINLNAPAVDPQDPDANQPINNSILGNSIHDNGELGIVFTTGDAPYTYSVTPNDAGDPDYGPNHLMNFPVIQSVTSTNGTATITYDLDINDAEPGATGYRVEFFANDSADPSGHGQGQTYIGSDTVSGDVTGKQVTITLPNGVDGSKYITATTTMTDASDDGFGHTSEFAADVRATLLPPTPTPGPTPTPKPSGNSTGASTLADTGQDTRVVEVVAIVLLISGFASTTYLLINKRKKHCG